MYNRVKKAKVYVKFPKAGLGNMLLTWGRAYVFAELNNLEMYTSSWIKIHYGAWLRREKKKRIYARYFENRSLLKNIIFLFYLNTKKKVFEPPVQLMDTISTDTIFVFNKIFTDYDFFKEIRPYKALIKKGIFEMLAPRLIEKYNNCKKPVIGIHVRRGDFISGSTLTPISFFIDVINGLRKDAGTDLPVTVFTDAGSNEINELLKLNNINVAESKPDILDILLLASSEMAVLSVGSTFSYWAAFLSDGVIIKNNAEWHVPFRNAHDENFGKELIWSEDFKFAVTK